jgi:hypothetical protein
MLVLLIEWIMKNDTEMTSCVTYIHTKFHKDLFMKSNIIKVITSRI